MKNKFTPFIYLNGKKINILLTVLAFVFTVMVVFSGSFSTSSGKISIGDISPKRYIATRSVENTVETQRLRQKAENSVGNLYKHDPNVVYNAEKQIRDMFSAIDNGLNDMKIKSQEDAAKQNTLNRIGADSENYKPIEPKYDYSLKITLSVPVHFSAAQYEEYDKLQKDQKEKFEDDIIYAVNYAFEQGITEEIRQNTMESVNGIIEAYDWNDTLKSMASLTADGVIVPNLILDVDAINAAKAQKASQVEPVMVLKDQKIVDSGEVITAEAFAILTELNLINNGTDGNAVHVAGSIIIVILCFVSAVMYMYTLQKRAMAKDNSTILLFFIYALSLMILFVTEKFDNFVFVPLSVFAMLTSILIKPKIALVLNIFVCIIGSFIFNGDIYCIIYFLITGCFSAVLVQYTQKRTMVLIVSAAVGIVNMLAFFGIGIFASGYSKLILIQSCYAGITGIVSIVMVVGSLPLWEGIFGMNTKFTLAELANPNNELMRRLIIETPGTYHHSLVVANLAETAAYEIYANETLAKVGALFHDIGKLSNPQYFSENQFGGNIHDKLDPYISAQMIIKHVMDGIELADKVGLPKVIKDIIAQHHGTTLVKYFYVKCAKEKEATGEIVYEKDFRYPGPIPQSKEAAVVMLADTVEAAVRSFVSGGNDPSGIENLVDSLFKDKLNDGQLNDCRLDLKEIEIVKNSFLKMFNGMYHHRVSYPKEEEIEATRQKEAEAIKEYEEEKREEEENDTADR